MRNDDLYDRAGSGAGYSSQPGTGASGGMGEGAGTGGSGMSGAGASGSGMGGQGENTFERGADQAREGFEQAREAVRDKAQQAGEKAHDFRENVADRLKSGADRLRQRASGAGGPADGRFDRMLDSDAAHRIENNLASGMDSTADWIRNADADSIRNGIEEQVRNHPGRTLLVALGVGYLIGRAFGGGGEKRSSQSYASNLNEHGFGTGSTGHGLH